MKTIIEKERTTPVLAETEVLVVGSGPAGLAAALAAGRTGARTLVVERYGCLGGNMTQVGVESFAWYRHEHTVDCSGIGVELEQRAVREGISRKEPQSESHVIDAEGFKVVADRLLEEAGVEVLLHSLMVAAIVEKNRTIGIITEGKSGRQAILAKMVIDCTGDGDVAERAGAAYTKRDKKSLMGVSVMLNCAGVDVATFQDFVHTKLKPVYADWSRNWSMITSGREDRLFSPYFEKTFSQAHEDGVIPKEAQAIAGTWSSFTEAGEACCLNINYSFGYDCTDVRDLSRAEQVGRRQAMWAIDAFRHYLPGFENVKLRNFGMTLGTRESRQIVGEVRVDKEHVMNQGKCADSVGIFPEFIDGNGYLILPLTGRYYQIPYGCLVPREIENLLIAGRCVSADEVAHASMRNMMCCTVTGQAAGTAAAVALREGSTARQVPIHAVQEALKDQGVRIG